VNALFQLACRRSLASAWARNLATSRCRSRPAEIAAAYGRTVYDALYVALAVARDCVLVTADERLVAALARSPFARHVSALSRWPGQASISE
jgi:predicted nucleic acid-binding protein